MATKITMTPRTPVQMAGISRRTKLSLAIIASSLSLSSIFVNTAQAVDFNLGEVEGRFNSQISMGVSWRAEDRDPSLISGGNGGARSVTHNGVNDDGNLNFDDGDAFSKILKGVHDLELTYENVGFFARGKYWYDFELEDGDRSWGNVANNYASGEPLSDEGFNDYAKFSGAEILDAFVYGEFDLGDMVLDARLGRQVVSWGESTFIRGGVNAINPIDVSAFRRPGAEIKEGLLPVNMLYGNLGVTDNLSVEGFYQLEWEATAVDGCGTYFSTVDYIAQGCNTLTIGTAALAIPLILDDAAAVANGFAVKRGDTREADDDGQYGLAFRYIAEELNDTEFGFYFMNYHSRQPMASGMTTGVNQISGDLDGNGQPDTFLPGDPLGQNPVYFTEYPEDIQMLGLSFATNVGEFAVSGEFSHHKDVPFQINGADLVAAILTGGTQVLSNGAVNPVNARVGAGIQNTLVNGLTSGSEVSGYDSYDISQAQVTLVRFIDQVMGASRVALVGELAFTHVHSFSEAGDGGVRYGRPSEYGQDGDDGFVTEDSWGYRARAVFNYNDVLAGINLTPSISWSHDVDGYSPATSSGFIEGRKALGLALNADYLNTYNAGISYTRFFGGDYNITKDRDFISASIGISF
ncbi:DUF1302 domain-containing protein [Motiliproteus sp. MSK22-1]|uniref:DUF1302 domain-containing protein n=1 Tax=Motiliproteus sp. MSK22-1 TaxID=1897630 RepID=UPI001E5FCFA6|nr:DUF1302 domain-containing protein [Motiliproteus sp. MSK22-1]